MDTLDLSQPDRARTWLMAFSARGRSKGWEDEDTKYMITDNFMATCGLAALEKTQFIVAPKSIESMKFADILAALQKYLRPKEKLTIAERTKFYSMKQLSEEGVMDYLVRLRRGIEFCDFDKLKSSADPADEMLLVALVAGLRDNDVKDRVLDKIQCTATGLQVDAVVSFVQQFEERRSFVRGESMESAKTVSISEDVHYQKTTASRLSRVIKNCTYCGKTHEVRKCPAFGKSCSKCSKKNHFSSVCRARNPPALEHHVQDSDGEDGLDNVYCVICNIDDAKVKTESVLINSKAMKMQVDTGASCSVISTVMWKQMGKPPLTKCLKRLEAYDGHTLKTAGKFTALLEKRNVCYPVQLVVVESEKTFGLMGRDILDDIKAKNVYYSSSKAYVDTLPTIKGVVAGMQLIDNAADVFCRARQVPIALEQKVNSELDRLEQRGIISRLEGGSSNASPVVWVRKSNGNLRMCVDFKAHVNAKIKSEAYPTPSTEIIFAKLKNAKKFAKLDLTEAYSQIELNDEAKRLSIINTTKGLYTVNRLQMGMKNSQAIFQRTMESILSDLKGVLVYHDDILIFAENDDSLEKRLKAVKTRLNEKRVTINKEKSINYADELTYLGFRVSARGIEPDNELVEKIVNIETPRSRKDVDHFVGMANYFGRLIPNFADIVTPLNKLRKKGAVFAWNAECSHAFESIKKMVSSSPVVQPYSLNKEVTLTTDASQEALGACLTQDSHPVIYISRRLTDAERNYSNIEREALAILWAVVRLKHFLLGRTFVICTDHQPLIHLFGRTSAIPMGTSARICRWALQLMAYDYSIRYVKGADIPHVDALSRMKFKTDVAKDTDDAELAALINCIEFEKSVLDLTRVQNEVTADSFTQNICHRVRSGNWNNCSQAEKPFKDVAKKLTIEDDVLYMGTRLYVPPKLRKEAFNVNHSDNHSGVQSTIHRMSLSTWWPGMARDIQSMVQACEECRKVRPSFSKSVHKWPEAAPLERWHMDWADVGFSQVLIVVDAGSGWIEAFPTTNRLSSTVIRCLRCIFTRFGVPVCLVSDNGPELVSEEINTWLARQGVRKLESPKYFPRANGLAERAVQTVKAAISTWKEYKYHTDFNSFLQRILFHHRVSAASRGKSPSELVFGRPLRVPIVSRFQQGENVWYKANLVQPSKAVTYIMTKGSNTSYVLENEKLVLVSNNQLAPSTGPADDVVGRSLQSPEAVCEEIPGPPEESKEEPSSEEKIGTEVAQPIRRSTRLKQQPSRLGFDE